MDNSEAVISAGVELLDKDTALVQTTYKIILLPCDIAICMECDGWGGFQGEWATNKSPAFFIVSRIFGHLETIIQIDTFTLPTVATKAGQTDSEVFHASISCASLDMIDQFG